MKAGPAARSAARMAGLVAVLGFGVAAQSQPSYPEPFEAIPKALLARYRFDLGRNFFVSPEAEKAERAGLQDALRELEQLKGQATRSAESALRALELWDRIQSLVNKHGIYLYLRYATDVTHEAIRTAQSDLNAEVDARTSFLVQELGALDVSAWKRFASQQPRLRAYTYFVESARRSQPHRLPARDEELLGMLQPEIESWAGDLFEKTLATTDFGTVHTPEGDVDARRQAAALRAHSDRKVREDAFRKNQEALGKQRDIYAFALTRLIRARNKESRLRHFDSSPAQVHFEMGLTDAQVRELLEALADRSSLNKRYERMVADRVRARTGVLEVHFWDLAASAAGAPIAPRLTIAAATRSILEAVAPFGPDYQREMAALLDPANGRIDIAPGEHRRSGGFSSGFPGSGKSVFYSSSYEGYMGDVVILAHEAGHAVQSELMAQAGVLPSFANGPSYFTESFAILNELLLTDSLARHAASARERTFFLEQFLERALVLFRSAQTALVEEAMYRGVEEGKIQNADDLEAVASRIGARFSMWFENGDRKLDWINVPQYYRNPMYRLNFVLAGLLALEYYERFTNAPQEFVPKYLELLRNGYDAPPDALLRRFLGIEMHDPHLQSTAMSLLQRKLDELAALYDSEPAK